MAHIRGTAWALSVVVLGFLPLACSESNDEEGRDASPEGGAALDARSEGATPDAFTEGVDAAQDASLDAHQDTTSDAAQDALPEGSLPDGDPGGTDVVIVEGGDVPTGDTEAGAVEGGDGSSCTCQANVSLDCFFDPRGPFANGPRPTTDVGFADRICDYAFPLSPCVDNVEIFTYDDTDRTLIVVTGCYAIRLYLFDRSTHALVGASYNTDTDVACRGGGSVFNLLAGESVPPLSMASNCSLVCRLIGGTDMPECKARDAGAEADGHGDAADATDGTETADAPDTGETSDAIDVGDTLEEPTSGG